MSTIPPARAGLLVLVVALVSFANSVRNGFAYDDNTIIMDHPVVTEGRVIDALSSSYWPVVVEGAGLYRPLTLSSFALEWGLWNGHPMGFHLVNVAVHAAVSLLVFLLILEVTATLPALVGGVLFAAHPVHSEAVANVVVGFVVSVLGQLAIFSTLAISVAWEQNVVIGLWFTGLSLARSYGLRRLFDGWAV